MKMKGEMCFIK